MDMNITDEQIRAWCAYLAAFHTAVGNDVELPISPKCTHPSKYDTGCGTCYWCTEQLITRALFGTSTDLGNIPTSAHAINDAVFTYVSGLDPERLTSDDGLGDDYARMTSVQYARVMNWAATVIPRSTPITSHGQADYTPAPAW
jgi:hypothetical protein